MGQRTCSINIYLIVVWITVGAALKAAITSNQSENNNYYQATWIYEFDFVTLHDSDCNNTVNCLPKPTLCEHAYGKVCSNDSYELWKSYYDTPNESDNVLNTPSLLLRRLGKQKKKLIPNVNEFSTETTMEALHHTKTSVPKAINQSLELEVVTPSSATATFQSDLTPYATVHSSAQLTETISMGKATNPIIMKESQTGPFPIGNLSFVQEHTVSDNPSLYVSNSSINASTQCITRAEYMTPNEFDHTTLNYTFGARRTVHDGLKPTTTPTTTISTKKYIVETPVRWNTLIIKQETYFEDHKRILKLWLWRSRSPSRHTRWSLPSEKPTPLQKTTFLKNPNYLKLRTKHYPRTIDFWNKKS